MSEAEKNQEELAAENTDAANADEAIELNLGAENSEEDLLQFSAPEQQIEELEAKVADYFDRMTRTQAEMDNLRKRTTRDIENAHKFALEPFVKELLGVVDSMDLGLKAADDAGENSEEFQKLREGMDLTRKQMLGVLEKFNVEVVDAMGAKFDPEQHEAMTMVPNPEMEPNTVMDVIQKGYLLNGRLIRAAKVIVVAS